MSRIRTVNLELLRHGPSHNQLLSPLTRYIGLCGNHSAATVTVPFEHEHFLGRLNTLRYQDSSMTRQIQLKDMASKMSEVLAEIRGLIAELRETQGSDDTLTHLQLVLSASELALLPFELAEAPEGFPGAGQPLALQKQLPLSITRQVRRVSNDRFAWPREPRILFISAAPAAAGKIPLEGHLQMLRQVVDPWVHYYQRGDRAGRRSQLDAHLVVLLQASVAAIQETCRSQSFTHVHILAHGVEIKDGADEGFGLALHDSHHPARIDKVDGARLAAALRTFQPEAGGGLSTPAVVSLAACDSGQVGSVVGAGASIAHALHAAGIPLVVASQFPLSFDGSVVIVETLYRRLFEGDDPRHVLSDLRQLLRIQVPGSHDWASLVAYAALPPDLEYQLEKVRLRQANRSIEAAFDWIDNLIVQAEELYGSTLGAVLEGPRSFLETREIEEFEAGLRRLDKGKDRLQRMLDGGPQNENPTEILGRLASAEKRKAQLLYRVSDLLPEEGYKSYRARSRAALSRALDAYEQAFKNDRSSHWTLVQFLSLSVVLKARKSRFADLWTFARVAAELDLESDGRSEVAWAHGSLVELHMLSVALPAEDDEKQQNEKARARAVAKRVEEATANAVRHAGEVVRIMGRDSFHVYSTRRQFERYLEWYFAMFSHPQIEAMVPVAEAVLKVLKV